MGVRGPQAGPTGHLLRKSLSQWAGGGGAGGGWGEGWSRGSVSIFVQQGAVPSKDLLGYRDEFSGRTPPTTQAIIAPY